MYITWNRQGGCSLSALLEALVPLILLERAFSVRGRSVHAQKSDTATLQNTESDGYPDHTEGLQALSTAPAKRHKQWNGPCLKHKQVPPAPWEAPCLYRKPGRNGICDLYRLGADGAPGDKGSDRDVYNRA